MVAFAAMAPWLIPLIGGALGSLGGLFGSKGNKTTTQETGGMSQTVPFGGPERFQWLMDQGISNYAQGNAWSPRNAQGMWNMIKPGGWRPGPQRGRDIVPMSWLNPEEGGMGQMMNQIYQPQGPRQDYLDETVGPGPGDRADRIR